MLRYSSTGIPRRTRPRKLPESHRNLRQHSQNDGFSRNGYAKRYTTTTNRTLYRRDHPHSFHGLRACYFSNAAEQTVENNNDIDGTSPHLIEEDGSKRINYVQALKAWYLEHHGEMIRDAFETEMIQNPNSKPDADEDTIVDGTIRQLFTASFTCPVTNERFEAGRLNGYYDIDNRNFYTRKKVALQAVSAAVLGHKTENDGSMEDFGDNFDVAKQHVNDQTHRQVLQKLYMKNFKTSPTKSQSRILKQDFVGKTHGGTWWTSDFTCPITNKTYETIDLEGVSDKMKLNEAGRVWYRKMSDSIHAAALNVIESIDWDAPLDELEKNAEPSIEKEEWKDMLRPLLYWYAQHGGEDLEISIDDNFVVTEGSNDDAGRPLWTASFLCPLTGERFDSGTINATDAISSTERDNLIWYSEKDAALQAASQRAYDVLKYRETGVNDPRFCKEDPDIHSAGETQATTVLNHDTEQNMTNDDEIEFKDDDFVIEVIPQQIVQQPNSGSSGTLDIIAKAWIDSTAVESPQENSLNGGIENFQNSFLEREKAISRASEWTWKQDKRNSKISGDRTQFDVKGEVGNLKIANAILSSLADCHQRIPFDSKPSGVEDCAVAILESMWLSHSTKPDAQSYAYFLKTLEGETPTAVATKAQKIVDAMESGRDENQRALPKPNDAVYGSLFEIRALAGLESAIESNSINSLERKSHLYKLSAMSHDPSKFDIVTAKKLIDEMKSLSETSNDPSLRPDVEVFNAPLRWSGGHLWSRSYSRVIPWDSYSKIYENGFKADSSVDRHQKYAEKVEQWIEIMKNEELGNNSLSPNIETYESLIQALIRCGNRESLIHAEVIAKSIISRDYPDIEPRLVTFYPILAAWAYSGCAEGPEKVDSWINLLEETIPNLKPSVAFPNVSIMAEISLQRQILNQQRNGRDIDSSCGESCIFESANKCSRLLNESIERCKSSLTADVQGDVFMLVINAWFNAASSAMQENNLQETKKCFKEIQNTVDQFDDTLRWLHQVDATEAENKEVTDFQAQFSRLLNLSPSVYGAQLEAVSAMERILDPKNYDRTMHLISIEEKIRRLEEFHQFWGDDDGRDIDDSLLKGITDLKTISLFPREDFMGDLLCRCWSDYINSALDTLEKGATDSSIGEADFLRLALLIARVSSGANPAVLDSSTKGRIVGKVVDILESHCGDIPDRKTVISTVIQSLNKYSFAPGSKELKSRPTTSKHDDNEKVNAQTSDTVNVSVKRKPRRERANRSDLRRSSYSRSKVSNRSVRRRSRPRHAEQSE